MKIKYKNIIYSSEDVPLFLYFQSDIRKKNFETLLANYNPGEFAPFNCLHCVLAGNTLIKDKRSKIYICIDSREEKRLIIKNTFDSKNYDNNAMICSPADISEESIIDWINKNIKIIN